MKNKEIVDSLTKTVLAAILVVGFFLTLYGLFTTVIPESNAQMANTVIVALISILSLAVGYYFGSSSGSDRKTEIMKGENK